MQTVIIELTNKDSLKALQELEEKRLIRILESTDKKTYSLPGEPMTEEDFNYWIESAEKSQNITLNEAKKEWTVRKKGFKTLST